MASLRRIAVRPLPRAVPSLLPPRPYHSYDHPPTQGTFNDTENAILSAAYRHVPDLGFTQAALSRGARDAGYSDVSTTALQDGLFSLIRYHLVTKREALAGRSSELFSGEGEGLGTADRVERLTWERLLSNRDVVHKWQEACFSPPPPRFHPYAKRDGN